MDLQKFPISAITIQQAKKDVGPQKEIVTIEKIFLFYHLIAWQSWQVVGFHSYEYYKSI